MRSTRLVSSRPFAALFGCHLQRNAIQESMLTWNCSESVLSCDRRHSRMNFLSISFVVDLERCCDVYLLFAYLNGADSYTKL